MYITLNDATIFIPGSRRFSNIQFTQGKCRLDGDSAIKRRHVIQFKVGVLKAQVF